MALELRQRGMIDGIFPIFIGDRDAEGCYSDYFAGGCHPLAVAAVAEKLQLHLDTQGLGAVYLEQANYCKRSRGDDIGTPTREVSYVAATPGDIVHQIAEMIKHSQTQKMLT